METLAIKIASTKNVNGDEETLPLGTNNITAQNYNSNEILDYNSNLGENLRKKIWTVIRKRKLLCLKE